MIHLIHPGIAHQDPFWLPDIVVKKMGDGGDGSKEDIIDLLSNVLKSPHQIDLGVQI